jgi:hypothetical protein
MKKSTPLIQKASSDKESVSRSKNPPVIMLELKKVPFTQNKKIKYRYEAILNGKVLAERIDGDGNYIAGYVIKNYRHPFSFSIAHLFRRLDRIGKGESKNKRPYAIALDKGITIKEIFEGRSLVSMLYI